MTSTLELASPQTLHKAAGYSHTARASTGALLFVAGQVALDPQGQLVGRDDFAAQAEQVFSNLKAAVEAAGATLAHLAKLNVFVLDTRHLADYRAVRDRYIDTAHPPASTAVQVAALFRPEFLIEVEAVAVVP